ncbi:hypothetical protein ATK74_1121 [Propionicimonas paludicola]|uniref:Uncharacterized protein n=1 Tax=Propionicimonas paludicola TaxID=185243 RepID=A0A2A9CQ73_9ACTN|nr:hypothetical protein [Propionicimonas paludicola]PFG16574.1 hypothetical protein ATK74_1121 [Propionicimonas paludicola]
MSALAITEAVDTTWAEVPSVCPAAELRLVPAAPSVPSAGASGWQLTERGIAVAVIGSLMVFLTGLVVLVGAFLAVPDRPLDGTSAAAASISVQQ